MRTRKHLHLQRCPALWIGISELIPVPFKRTVDCGDKNLLEICSNCAGSAERNDIGCIGKLYSNEPNRSRAKDVGPFSHKSQWWNLRCLMSQRTWAFRRDKKRRNGGLGLDQSESERWNLNVSGVALLETKSTGREYRPKQEPLFVWISVLNPSSWVPQVTNFPFSERIFMYVNFLCFLCPWGIKAQNKILSSWSSSH